MKDALAQLSRRERQIMSILYGAPRALTVSDVRAGMRDAPSRSAVRALLRILEEKGHLRHRVHGRHYVFEPARPRETVQRSALQHLVDVFFGGAADDAVVALLGMSAASLTRAQCDRVAAMLDGARAPEEP